VNEVAHRLDVELVARGLARSRGQARDLVKAGSVLIDGSPAKKVATPVHADQSLELAAGVEGWVSRAAYKLVAALEAFGPRGLSVAGKRCFDVGAAAGGFTQVLLRRGARQVVAAATTAGLTAKALCASPIRGATGNAEYLLWLTPRPDQGLTAAQVTQLAATLSTEAFT